MKGSPLAAVLVTFVLVATCVATSDTSPAGAMQAGVVQAVGPEPSAATVAPPQVEARPVDLVICLDTSGSMSGLIESAKQKLWAVVNELATARPRPKLRVALYHYGNTGLDAETGWVKQLCPLTNDLDKVYGELFALKTNGGDEYVARVLDAATRELDWSDEPGSLKIVFVAGNEPATQDPKLDLEETCKAAIAEGIIVNTIHCGDESAGRNSGWADAARWADGRYAAIDQDHGTVVINTPYDEKLAELSGELNETYIAYGDEGQRRAAEQTQQDANARALNAPAAAERANAKASALYQNSAWDLVDASKEEDFDLAKIDKASLPKEMQEMTSAEREKYVAENAKRRAEIQQQIQDLSKKRDAFVRKETEKQGLDASKSFDTALRRAVREQGAARGLRFPEEQASLAPEEEQSAESAEQGKGN